LTVVLLCTRTRETLPWQFWFVATLYLASNIVYVLEAVEHFLAERVRGWIFLFDVALVSTLYWLALAPEQTGDFWIPYFLTVLVAAMAASLRSAVCAGLVSTAVYGFVLYRASPYANIFTATFFIHATLYLITALFIGVLAESARRERLRRGGIEQTLAFTTQASEIFDLGRLADLSKDPRGLARHLYEISRGLFVGDSGSLMLVDSTTGELRVAVSKGLDPIEGPADPTGIASYVVRTGEALLLIGAPPSDPRFAHLRGRPDIRSSISVPIRHAERTYGVLTFNRGNPHLPDYTRTDLRRAEAFAIHVGLALANGEVFSGLTHRYRSAQELLGELRRNQEDLIRKEKHAAVDEIVTGVARSLNDPLTGIIGSAELMQERIPAGSQLRLGVEAILADAARCRRLVEQLLAINRPSKPNRVPTPVVGLVEEVLGEHESRMEDAGIALVTRYEPDELIVTVDRQMMRRALAHLIVNAVRSMERRTDAVRKLGVDVAREDANALIAISDSGGGVRLDHIQHVFQPFFTTSPEERVLGLGLSTAQSIIRENGGAIRAISDGVDGATFLISLPLHESCDPQAAGGSAADDPEDPAGPPPRILLMDPDPSIRRIISEVLGGRCEVEQTGDPKEALDLLGTSDPFQALVLDLSLPERGGMRLYDLIKLEHPEATARVIFITSTAPSADQSTRIDRSGAPFLRKPFALDDLRDVLTSVLR
jgi:signal transduction histidine kinase/CheY-like chemotaxis protein